jgi:TRAP-type C4-dicarboxylate transport system permease small subunit
MRPFDVATWTAIVILVVGSSGIFLWFLKDAGRVLRGDDSAAQEDREEERQNQDERS